MLLRNQIFWEMDTVFEISYGRFGLVMGIQFYNRSSKAKWWNLVTII